MVRTGVGRVGGVARAAMAARQRGTRAAPRTGTERRPAPAAAAPRALPPSTREGQPTHGGSPSYFQILT